jgi:hypothetical protein
MWNGQSKSAYDGSTSVSITFLILSKMLGDTWKNQGLGLAISAKRYIQNVILKIENLFDKVLK